MIDKLEDIPEVERIERLALKPGEVIVIFSKMTLPKQHIDAIEKTFVQLFPNNKVVILEDELDLKIVSPEALESVP